MAGDFKNPLDRMDRFTDDDTPAATSQGGQQTSYGNYPYGFSHPSVDQGVQQNQNVYQGQQTQQQPSYQSTSYNQPMQNAYGQPAPIAPSQPQMPQPMQNKPDETSSLAPNPKTVTKVEQLFIFIYLFIAALLLFRFVLSLFGADLSTIFVKFVYDLTTPFMFPFIGMFGDPVGVDSYRIEFEVLVALAVYALVFFGIARLIRIIFR